MKFIFVEDGSVDIEQVEQITGIKVIPYRQGATSPLVYNFDTERDVIENFAKELTEQYKDNSHEISGTDCEEEWLGRIVLEYYEKLLEFRNNKGEKK